MLHARTLIDEVTTYLLDDGETMGYDSSYRNEHWREEELLTYFRLAVSIVASMQRDKFVKRVSVPLVSGAVQTIPEQCRESVKVLGQTDDTGKIVSFPRKTPTSAMHLYGKVGCRDCTASVSADNYRVNSWQYDEDDPNTLYVEPPVPDGANATLEITCFVPPTVSDADDSVDLGDQLRPAVFELMLYYAYGRDTESVPARDRSAMHWNNAVSLLGGDIQAQKNRYVLSRTPELRAGARK